MDFLMNGLLLAATCFAGGYCWVLARRVRDLKSLDKGLGGAIVTLTRQVELARTTLEEARGTSRDSKLELSKMVQQADAAANHLRLLIAAAPHAVPARPAPAAAPQAVEPTPDPEPAEAPATQIRLAARPRPVVPPTIVPESDSRGAPPFNVPSLDRLVAGPLARPQPAESARPAAHLAEVPKPRVLAPIENPLRRLRPAAAKPVDAGKLDTPKPDAAPAAGEDAILEALSALAGGR